MLKILIAKISFYFNLIQFEIILMEFAFRISMLQIHPNNSNIINYLLRNNFIPFNHMHLIK